MSIKHPNMRPLEALVEYGHDKIERLRQPPQEYYRHEFSAIGGFADRREELTAHIRRVSLDNKEYLGRISLDTAVGGFSAALTALNFYINPSVDINPDSLPHMSIIFGTLAALFAADGISNLVIYARNWKYRAQCERELSE